MSKVWEYRKVEVAVEECERSLNEMGRQGWELVAAMNDPYMVTLFFKREVFECL